MNRYNIALKSLRLYGIATMSERVNRYKAEHPDRYREIAKAASRRYREKNREVVNRKQREAYKAMREAGGSTYYMTLKRQPCVCICGSRVHKYNLKRHLTTRRHRSRVN